MTTEPKDSRCEQCGHVESLSWHNGKWRCYDCILEYNMEDYYPPI
jgi:hypothetical protein